MDTPQILYTVIIYPIVYILPAYVANGAPVLFGYGAPLDFGRKFLGKRIFGDHKTIRGLVSGLFAGTLVGLLEYPFFQYMITIAIALAVGAMVGDLAGSFIKRRLDLRSGASVPILDQYGFFVVALAFAYPLGNIPSIYGLLFIAILTGMLHVLTNMGAHRLKLKSVPW